MNSISRPWSRACTVASMLLVTSLPHLAGAAGEPYRPEFHFTPERNWLNDPNGLVYYKGEYHMFFQYNPFGIAGANKSWAHAVSRDLVTWEELPVAIVAENGIEIFSGSAVIDWNNTSGFGNGTEPPMVAIYTGAHGVQDQRIAYSNDRGRTFTNYSGNPVINLNKRDFRDPNVFWHEATSKWVMAVALPIERKVQFYNSPNLKNWTLTSEFGPAGAVGGIWECPSFHPLKIEGDGGAEKWVMIISTGAAPSGGTGSQYFVGDFDGITFTVDPPAAVPPLPEGTLITDFEGTSYGSWTTTGNAFGSGPVTGTLPGQNPVTGFLGNKLVNSYLGNDTSTGTLTSPPFQITKKHISFLIGGGNLPGQTCINLIVGGSIVRTATGDNDETLNWKSWDVSQFAGMNATLRIVDSATGSWGHVNVDHILMADTPVPKNPDSTLWLDHGPDNYAAITWNDLPSSDPRRLLIGWMVDLNYAGSIPTTPWKGGMTITRELALRRTSQGLRIVQKPVEEVKGLHKRHLTRPAGTISEVNAWLGSQDIPTLMDGTVELEVPEGGSGGLRIGNSTHYSVITWDRETSELIVDRTKSGAVNFNSGFARVFRAPVYAEGNRLGIRFLLDTGSLEVFSADGTTTLTTLIFPAAGTRGLQVFGNEGTHVTAIHLSEVGSILTPKPDGLLGEWLFDETTPGTYADTSGNGHTMTNTTSTLPAVVPGRSGNAMEVRRVESGQVLSHTMVPAAGSLMPDSFTVSYHFNPKSNDNSKLSQLRWETPAGLAWGFEILNNRRMNFYVFDSDSADDVQSVTSLPQEAFDTSGGTSDNIDNDPTWHHVAASYDAKTGKLTLYLNGVKSEKTSSHLVGAPRYGSVGIGGGIRTGNGLTIFDDLRIYGRVLTDTEVEQLRGHPGTGLPPVVPPPATPPTISIEPHGGSAFIEWPADTGLALWKSSTLAENSWEKVTGSERNTRYTTVMSAKAKLFFRLGPP